MTSFGNAARFDNMPSNVEVEYVRGLQEQIQLLQLESQFYAKQISSCVDSEIGMQLKSALAEIEALKSTLSTANETIEEITAGSEASAAEASERYIELQSKYDDVLAQLARRDEDLTVSDALLKEAERDMEDSAAERIELRQAADEVLRLREVEVQLTSQLDEQRKVSLDVSARLDEIESKIPENEALVEQWKQENYNARLKVKHLELALDQERAFQAQAAEQRGAVAEQNARLGAEVDALRSLVMQERTERDKKIRQGLADAATEIAEKDREVTELTRLSLEHAGQAVELRQYGDAQAKRNQEAEEDIRVLHAKIAEMENEVLDLAQVREENRQLEFELNSAKEEIEKLKGVDWADLESMAEAIKNFTRAAPK